MIIKTYQPVFEYVRLVSAGMSRKKSGGCGQLPSPPPTLRNKDIKIGSILDVGCGDGKLLSMLARQKPGLRLWGVDANKKCVMNAKKALGNKANILYGDAQELSYFLPEKDFDIVTAIGILDTQVTTREESLKILAAIHDIMGKNGLFIAAPYTMSTLTHKEIQKKYEIHKKTVPQNFFTHKEPKDFTAAEKTKKDK